MSDLTILYYSSNYIEGPFLGRVRDELVKVTDAPVISITQKPTDFGHNICVGDIGRSIYNIYRQILIGAMFAQTDYIACAEDDILHNEQHFKYRPALNEFAYNMNRWGLDGRGFYYYRPWVGMCCCVAPRKLLIKALCERLAKFPDAIPMKVPQPAEPGKRDKKFGLKKQRLVKFYTESPVVIFNHRSQVGGKRKILETDKISSTIEPWGDAEKTFNKFWQ
jgi:hypothetical protein